MKGVLILKTILVVSMVLPDSNVDVLFSLWPSWFNFFFFFIVAMWALLKKNLECSNFTVVLLHCLLGGFWKRKLQGHI